MTASHCFKGMEYSDDRATIADWAPLIMDGRDDSEPFAATRIVTGTDVDYGTLTHLLVKHLSGQHGFRVHYDTEVVGLDREADGRWRVTVRNAHTREKRAVSAKFVFIGAGGGTLPLLQASEIPEGKGYGGLPRQRHLVALRRAGNRIETPQPRFTARRHRARRRCRCRIWTPAWWKASHSVLFGPYAGFSTRFLKHGKLTDLFGSLTPYNLVPLLDVARDNVGLSEYLLGQVLQSSSHQFATLKQFFPRARKQDWTKAVADQRVQTIKPHETTGWFKHEAGTLEFGTELVVAADKSIVALLGASPGASTAAHIALEVLQKCFGNELTDSAWLPRLKTIIPTYGIDLKTDADACRKTRADTAPVLQIENV